MSKGEINRPQKWGSLNRREYIVQDSEVTLAAINDIVGNPIFLGRAKVGTQLNEPKWQIRKISWDGSQSPTRVEWAENYSSASADYEFVWSEDTNLIVTGITQANPAVVTVSSIGTLMNGDQTLLQDVSGMTEVNFDGSNLYTVAGISGSTFQLLGINSTAFTAYVSGGTATFGAVINYTFS